MLLPSELQALRGSGRIRTCAWWSLFYPIELPPCTGRGIRTPNITDKESKKDQAAYPNSGHYGAVQKRSSGPRSALDVFILHRRNSFHFKKAHFQRTKVWKKLGSNQHTWHFKPLLYHWSYSSVQVVRWPWPAPPSNLSLIPSKLFQNITRQTESCLWPLTILRIRRHPFCLSLRVDTNAGVEPASPANLISFHWTNRYIWAIKNPGLQQAGVRNTIALIALCFLFLLSADKGIHLRCHVGP